MVSEKDVNVFIVDDNIQTVTSISNYLESKGFKTTWAYNEKDASNLFKENKPDIVVMGVMFQHTTGFEIAKKLNGAKIIFMTSHPPLVEEAKKTKGCVGVIGKPVDFEQLVVKLRELFKIPKPKFA